MINIEHLDEWAGIASEVDFACERKDFDLAFQILNVYVCKQDALMNADQRIGLVAPKIEETITKLREHERNKGKRRVVNLAEKLRKMGSKI